jgi:hypothetical protein
MSPFFQFIHRVKSDICVKGIVLMYEKQQVKRPIFSVVGLLLQNIHRPSPYFISAAAERWILQQMHHKTMIA